MTFTPSASDPRSPAGSAADRATGHAGDPEPGAFLADFARAGLEAPHLDAPLEPTDPALPPLGWGVVGPGAIADRVVPDLALLPDARLIAVSSRSPERAQAFADKHGFSRGYGDDDARTGLEALARDPEVEVVYVASPHGYHHEHVSLLLRAGKHVVCEKALAVTAAEVRDLVHTAARQQVLLMEAVWTAMTPGFRFAMRTVADGGIGAVRAVTGAIGFPSTAGTDHRLFAADAGGGVTLDMLVYPLLWSDALQGAITDFSAVGHLGETGVDDDLAVQLTRDTGWAQVSATLVRSPAPGVVVSGSRGWIRVDGRLNNPPQVEVMTSDRAEAGVGPHVESIDTVGAGYVPQMREATRCIRTGATESPFVPWERSVQRAELFDAVRARLGVHLPNDLKTWPT